MNTNENTAVFTRVGSAFLGLSNMAAGFPLLVNESCIPTCENLFQALKFPEVSG